MANRFVSGGTIRSGNEVAAPADADQQPATEAREAHGGARPALTKEPLAAPTSASTSIRPPPRWGVVATQQRDVTPEKENPGKVEWERVQQELEAERKRREEQRAKAAAGEEEKSLYDILQANKAAKQAAFEEQTKVRNQFRALDDDEIEFLDDVRQRKREEEEKVRRETEEGLRAFRERQQHGGSDAASSSAAAATGQSHLDDSIASSGLVEGEAAEQWAVGRKRKRAKDREGKVGLVKRKGSGTGKHDGEGDGGEGAEDTAQVQTGVGDRKGETRATPRMPPTQSKKPAQKASALVSYGSDDSDDD